MRILIISQYFYPENFRINDLCYGLKDNGHEVTVLTGKPNYPKGSFYKGYNFLNKGFEVINGINVYRSNLIPRGSGNGIRLLINYISFLFFGTFKLFFLKEKKFDKIFVYAPSPITVGYIGGFASFLFRSKAYLWVHDLWPESVKDTGGITNGTILSLVNIMTKSIYSFYDTILVQSPRFNDYLSDQGVPSNKIVYYPYYAESFYKIVEPKPKIKKMFPKGLNILFAGNIGIAQSFDTIIDAVKIISTKMDNFNIIVLGEGRDKKRVLDKIKALKINNFKFFGIYPPDQMSDFFASADALLVSLKKSKIFSLTIPGKMQSYLACGKPIIGSLDGIGAEIITNSNSGYATGSEDSKGLANSILKFNRLNNEQRIKLGLNGRLYYEREFERKKLLLKLIDIFNREKIY